MPETLVERLGAHRTLGSAPREQLAWLAERGELQRHGAGTLLYRSGERIPCLYVVFSGLLDIRIHRGGSWRKVMEWRGGDVSGHLPFSRMRGSPGETRVLESTELLALSREQFPELIRDCQEVTAILVHVMLDRARHFRASDLHDEKLASLGRLAAGLAHELNNPASAAARNAAALVQRMPEAEAAFLALGQFRLSPAELEAFVALRDRCLAKASGEVRSPLEQADRVEELGDQLESHGVDRALAEPLAETGITAASIAAAAGALPREALAAALTALGEGCAARRLALDTERAASRIHELVAAVKGFTYMDQAAAPKPVDLARGVADTLAVLRSKAKAKSIRLTAEIPQDLPAIFGLGGELNQIWANLIDNAIDAVAAGGSVAVSASEREGGVEVKVVDDGPGIPADVIDRIFEPFFTTKEVGEGTGLGLVTARSLARQNGGEIELESRPGHTEFRVVLPRAPRPEDAASGNGKGS